MAGRPRAESCDRSCRVVTFDALIERARPVAVADTVIPVVQKADLIAMKERAGEDPARHRSQMLRDLADVELLRGDVAEEDEGW